ncbi:MAG TPA: hypothetical protein PK762_02020 [Candidatus Kapabacteria bacterium]|nr:hypothetical protein [Candidatus Kapabacteria bacterium]
MRKIVVFCLLTLALTSCNIFKSNPARVELIEKEKIVIPIGEDIECNTNYFKLLTNEDNKELLYYLSNSETLTVFDLQNNNISFEIPLKQGNDAIHIISKDSILIIPERTNNLQLVDSKGNTLQTWKTNDIFQDSIVFEHYTIKAYTDNSNNLNIFLETNHSLRLPEYYLYPKIMYLKINKEGKVIDSKKFAKYPISFYQKEYMAFDCIFELNSVGALFVNYMKENCIYEYNKNVEYERTINFQSKYIKDGFIYIKKSDSVGLDYNVIQQMSHPFIRALYYDKYRNLYYVSAIHAQNYKNEDGTLNDYWDRSWSIIVFNSNFEIIDEIYMEPKKFRFSELAVSKDGLLISNNVESNPDFNPDLLQLTLFEVKVK